jgi:hypothetical protein
MDEIIPTYVVTKLLLQEYLVVGLISAGFTLESLIQRYPLQLQQI